MITSKSGIFEQEMGSFLERAEKELSCYLPALKRIRKGALFNLACFARTEPTEQSSYYLDYTNQGFILKKTKPGTNQSDCWRIRLENGKPVVEKYSEEFKTYHGLLEDEPIAVRAGVEVNFLICGKLAEQIKEKTGNFGCLPIEGNEDFNSRYGEVQEVLAKTAETAMPYLEYERQRRDELYRARGIKDFDSEIRRLHKG